MSAKTTASQPPGRRTPLSLNASTKQHINKATNDNTKKDNNTNNQKTDSSKKDFQLERKPSSDKKLSLTDTRKPSSHDSKNPEETKKNDDNKKSQNGVNSTNVVKDKEKQATNGGGSANKPKPETSSGSVNTPKKDSQKPIEKKKETSAEAVAKVPSKDIKTDDSKSNKEKTKEDSTKKDDGKKKEKDSKEVTDSAEQKTTDEKTLETTSEKPSESKTTAVKGLEKPQPEAKKELIDITELEILPEQIIAESGVKEKDQQDMSTKQEEKPVQPIIDAESEDVEMEPLVFELKRSPKISAASTPAKSSICGEGLPKASPKSETKHPKPPLPQSPDRKSCPRTFSSISGRRTIRPIGDYTFSGNLHIRESYRKINTELDFTTSSMNVTVGSEVSNNDSFSFFSRSRKRDRSTPTRQSTIEIQGDISPKSTKRPRIETGMAGFFNAMASPITMLRARFSRATVQSTPKKLVEISIEDDIVENVSGISVEEEITATEGLTVNPDSTVEIPMPEDGNPKEEPATCSAKPPIDVESDDDIKIKETLTNADMQAKKKCSIM